MKKILFIIPEFPSVSHTFIFNQIIGLIDLGYKIEIFAQGVNENLMHNKVAKYRLDSITMFPTFPNYFTRIVWLFKMLILSKNKKSIIKSINPFKYGLEAFKLTNFCKIKTFLSKKNNYDIVHVHFGQMLENYLLLKDVGLVEPNKVVLTMHGYDLDPNHVEHNRKRYHKLLTEEITVTVNTPYLETILNKTLPTFSNYHILPVGVDTNYFKRFGFKNYEKINIVFCGRFVKLKGVENLPKIIDNVIRETDRKVYFHIIGDGDPQLRENFLKEVKPHIQNGQVIYYGSISQEQILEVFNKANIFILPGIYDNGRAEAQGLVIQEAQAMELPVVVTDAGGMKYGLINNKTGFVTNHLDIDQFVKKIIEISSNISDLEQLGINGRNYVVKNYDIKVLTQRLINIYKCTTNH